MNALLNRKPPTDTLVDQGAANTAARKRSLTSALRAGVRQLDRVPALRELALPALLAVIWVLINQWAGLVQREGGEILGVVIAALTGYFVSYRIRMRGFVKSVKIIRQIADSSTLSAGRSLYVQMILDRMNLARKIVQGFQTDTYVANSPEEFQGWIDAFFRLGGEDYLAVDSHLPSQYWTDYGWFLEAHARFLRERRESGKTPHDVRILSVSPSELDDDFFDENKAPDYKRFVAWHRETDVELRVIRPEALSRIRETHGLETEDDIGLWARFAALFTPADQRGDRGVGIKLRVRDDVDAFPTYVIIGTVMAAIREESVLMDDAPPGVEMGDPALIRRWNDYLGPDLRWQEGGAYEKLLTSLLPDEGDVLDAAAGTGVDSVNLLARNYSVISNEVDPRLRKVAREFAAKNDVRIELRGERWEELTLAGNPRFEALLVLGNSLCLVINEARRRRALAEFYKLLRPGGGLVIDERNYEYMRRHATDICDDPYRYWLSGRHDVMYPGRDVLGYPSAIGDREVTWSFVDNAPQVTSTADIRNRPAQYASLTLYAFRFGELYNALGAAGFRVKSIYGDLQLLVDDPAGVPMPSYEATEGFGFITYVAERVPAGTAPPDSA